MKRALTLIAALSMTTSAAMAADTKTAADSNPAVPGREAGQTTSDRTPKQTTETPLSQTTKTDGETSDRTPAHHKQPD
jgi:hypothetical protein